MKKTIVMVFALFLAVEFGRADDWLSFRGPRHQGHAGPGDYPVKWGPKDTVAWKIKLPGHGASSPVVKGERVFVTSFTGVKGSEIIRFLQCYDRKSGKLIWEQTRLALQPESDYKGQHLQHGFATPTPIVEGDRVYVYYCRGGAYCFDLDGKEIWHRELGKFRNTFGSGASPSIHGDLLLVNATVEAGYLIALNKKTGETVWKTRSFGDCWATPVVVETAKGAKEIVLNAAAALTGFDPDTGKELWTCETPGGYVSSTPVIEKDILYIIGSQFNQKAASAIRAGGRGDVSKTHVVWTNKKVGASYCSPLSIGDRLYFFSGQATCLDRLTGEIIAQNRLDNIGNLYSSPIVAGGKIYLFTRNQGAYVLSADEKMTVLAQNDLGDASAINASPAASDGDLLIRSNEYLYCLRKK